VHGLPTHLLKTRGNKVVAISRFKGAPIDLDVVRESLKDVLAIRARTISVENIQRVVSEYFRIPLKELVGPKPRSIGAPLKREIATTLLSAPSSSRTLATTCCAINNAQFRGDVVRESLKDVLAIRARTISVENIQRVVSEYFRIPTSFKDSRTTSRSIGAPLKREIATTLLSAPSSSRTL
jgi:chromosomal replication initiation ATPase DnaA